MFSGIFLIFGGRELSTAEVNRLADSVVKTGKGVEPYQCHPHCSGYCDIHCTPTDPHQGCKGKSHCDGYCTSTYCADYAGGY
jgi:hypothetical protein